MTTTWQGNNITVLDGNDFIEVLYNEYYNYKTRDIKKSLPLYSKLNCHALEELTKNLYDYDLLNHFTTTEFTNDNYSDIAENTVSNTVHTPNSVTTTKTASYDSNVPNVQNEVSVSVNNDTDYTASSITTTYDKTDIGHNAVNHSTSTGRNIKLSDILEGEIKVRFKNIIMEYIHIYILRNCHYSCGVNYI